MHTQTFDADAMLSDRLDITI